LRLFGLDIKRAVSSEPVKGNRLLSGFVMPWAFGREHVDRHNVKSLLAANLSHVYVCASRNAANFASSPLRLFVTKKTSNQKIYAPTKRLNTSYKKELLSRANIASLPCIRKAVDVEEITEHRWLDTLQTVNPFMNRFSLLEISDAYQELTGYCYWYVMRDMLGLPVEIWPIPPDRMHPVPDPVKFVSHFIYIYGNVKIRFEPEEIVWFRWPDPSDPYGAMSPLSAMAQEYNIDRNMNTYENALFTNNCRLEGYFSSDEEISDTDFDMVKEELKEAYGGVKNAGKAPLLDKGIKFYPMNLAPKDLSFLKGREVTKQAIYDAYGVPEGLFDKTANRANSESAQYTYMKHTISPRHRRFEEKLNESLIPLYDEKLFVAFDNCVPEDEELEIKRNTAYVGVLLTPNEIRTEVLGKEPIEGGDTLTAKESPKEPQETDDNEDLDIDNEDETAIEDEEKQFIDAVAAGVKDRIAGKAI
jgi:HK97 family phage portal protein